MIAYIDTSVLVPVLIEELGSASARAWWKRTSDAIVLADLSAVEFTAVVSRGLRTGRFDYSQAIGVLADMDLTRSRSGKYHHVDADFSLAERIARDFSTKPLAADALHLASAIRLAARLATFDIRLADAARARGVEIVDFE